jgi:sugar lactone lactonase YvrE
MRFGLLPDWLNASPLQRAISLSILGCALAAGSTILSAQIISADNLTPFQPRDVGTTSDAKTVRISLRHPLALTSIAVAPGFSEFTAGAVSGCVVDGHTINPVFTACSLDVTFSPKYPGLRTAPLVVTDSTGAKSSVGLVGTGLAPQAGFTPGIITTIAGNGTPGFSGDGGPATSALISAPNAIAVDAAGNLYFSDGGNKRIRKVDTNGIITTVVPANLSHGVALDPAGNLYFEAAYSRVRKLDVNGVVTTVAVGTVDAQALAADVKGNLYIVDSTTCSVSCTVQKLDSDGVLTTVVAGNGNPGFSGDGGPAILAQLNNAQGLAVDPEGNLYIADTGNGRIRKVDTNGIITTVAGGGSSLGDGGPATSAVVDCVGVALDAAGNLYISGSTRVRKVDTNGTISTVAGNGTQGYGGDGGPATSAVLNGFGWVALDGAGNLYIADSGNQRIRKVAVSQSAAIFGPQNVGTVSPSQKVVVSNTGNQHMDLSGIELTGDFQQLKGIVSDCTDTTMLGAGFSCALRITFNPTTASARTGTATVTDNSLTVPGTTQTISLVHPYDATADFSSTSNPNGVWSYGWSQSRGATFNLYSTPTTNDGLDFWISNSSGPSVWYNPTSASITIGTVTIPAKTLGGHPGSQGENTVVRWTAPTNGTYQINAVFWGDDFTGPTTTDVAVLHNGKTLYASEVTGYGSSSDQSYTATVSANAGDTVDFSVGYGTDGNFFYDSTGVSAVITPQD